MTGIRLDHDWYPAALPDGVLLGKRSWLYSSFAFLHCLSERPHPVRVGDDSGVYHGSFFDLGPSGEVQIGDFCSVVGAIFCTDGTVEVHDYAFLAHEVVIADRAGAVPWPDGDRMRGPADAAPRVVIGENAWLGARAVVLGGVCIGRDAIVGAGAVVTTSVPDGATVAGNPARVVRLPTRADRGPSDG